VNFLNDSAGGGWNIHRRLLGLEGDQWRLRLDGLARFDENVDHRDVFEVAHVGHSHFHEVHSRVHRL
jgi:hypothetical protein